MNFEPLTSFMSNLSHIIIYTDGGSRSNPGEAASGVYITDVAGNKLHGFGKRLGIQTNNFAEYTAVILGLEWVIDHRNEFTDDLKIDFLMDSLLVCSQVKGQWKVKNEALGNLLGILREKEKQTKAKVTYAHIRREKNKEADRYVNLAL